MHYYLLTDISENAYSDPKVLKFFLERYLWYQKHLTWTSKVAVPGDRPAGTASAFRYCSEGKKRGFPGDWSMSAILEFNKFLLIISKNTRDTDYTGEQAEAYTYSAFEILTSNLGR